MARRRLKEREKAIKVDDFVKDMKIRKALRMPYQHSEVWTWWRK